MISRCRVDLLLCSPTLQKYSETMVTKKIYSTFLEVILKMSNWNGQIAMRSVLWRFLIGRYKHKKCSWIHDLKVLVLKRPGCHSGHQEASKCCTRSDSEESIAQR